MTRAGWCAVGLAIAACSRRTNIVGLDAAHDAALCLAGQPGSFFRGSCVFDAEPRTLADIDIDTDFNAPMCEHDAKTPVCMVTGSTITVPAGTLLSAHGSRPLLLVAYDTIDIEGVIEVGSRRTPVERIGPGADDPRCENPAGASDPVGGGGGAGGSFQYLGGTGGAVGAIAAMPPVFGTTPIDLHGGCIGGGGGAYQGSGGGASGHSGGAIYFIVGSSITIGTNAQIIAGGEGGGAAGARAGGGGGGSGGMIGLDAPTIVFATGARVIAEGGGGGAGGDASGGAADGGDGGLPTAVIGGAAISPAGAGGAGSLASAGGSGGDGPIDPTTSSGGGGGGGGASGHVLLFGTPSGEATISPPPTPR